MNKFKEVSFEEMLNYDGEIKCEHLFINDFLNKNGIILTNPMPFNEFLEQIGKYLTESQCKYLFKSAKWFVIKGGK